MHVLLNLCPCYKSLVVWQKPGIFQQSLWNLLDQTELWWIEILCVVRRKNVYMLVILTLRSWCTFTDVFCSSCLYFFKTSVNYLFIHIHSARHSWFLSYLWLTKLNIWIQCFSVLVLVFLDLSGCVGGESTEICETVIRTVDQCFNKSCLLQQQGLFWELFVQFGYLNWRLIISFSTLHRFV